MRGSAAAEGAAPRATRWLLAAALLGLLALSASSSSSSSAAPSAALGALAGAGAAQLKPLLSQRPPASASAAAASPSFNVIVTTAGRDSLARQLASIAPQLLARDHLTLISDGGHEAAARALAAAPCACAKRHIVNEKPLGGWGHGSRSAWQDELAGDFHMNADDDDLYDAEAMDIVRRHVASLEPRLYVFHMIRRWDGAVGIIPPKGTREVRERAIGTPCGVYRKVPRLPSWQGKYGGDAFFYIELAKRMNVTFVDEIIYQCKMDEDLLAIKGAFL